MKPLQNIIAYELLSIVSVLAEEIVVARLVDEHHSKATTSPRQKFYQLAMLTKNRKTIHSNSYIALFGIFFKSQSLVLK